MKAFWLLSLTALLPALSFANSTENINKVFLKNSCFACHDASAKSVGPSFEQIKLKSSSEDTSKLVHIVLNGSKGSWGRVPMPAQRSVTEQEAKLMIDFILNGNLSELDKG